MRIEQLYTTCLYQGAYFIESKGEIAVVDPLRDPIPYIEKANKINGKIKYIFETHVHADFVSGHLSLSKKTNAPIIYGPKTITGFKCIIAEDYQEFKVGDLTLQLIHTPGHTIESSCILISKANKKLAILTGDTLFLGDVGRPDLSQSNTKNKNKLAELLYDSLRNKIMILPDHILVYPAHGAGSKCGKNMIKETVDTLGNQKKTNYALREDMTKEEFVKEVNSGLEKPPIYFTMNVKMNKSGYEDIDSIINKSFNGLRVEEFEKIANLNKALILDVRDKKNYAKEHIPGSLFIGLEGAFAPWVGSIVKNVKTPILIVAPKNKEQEAIKRLSRVGFDNVLGYLKGGFNSWKKNHKKFDSLLSISVDEILNKETDYKFYDVRNKSEHLNGHISNTINVPLDNIYSLINYFPKKSSFYVHCESGYRSVIAISILKSKGFHSAINIKGGYSALKKGKFNFN